MMNLTPISDIKPYPGNPRVNDKAIGPVAASIKEFGFQQPIVVDKDNVIIVGHTRYEAAKTLGLTEVPVIVADKLSPEQVQAYRLADNRTNQNSEWDPDLLLSELTDLKDANFDLTKTAFTPQEIHDIFNEPTVGTPDSLAATFIVPPFSVLHGGNPTWLARKKAWTTSLSLRSGESREGAVCMSPAVQAGNLRMEGNTGGVSIFDPVLAEVLISWFSAPGDKVIDNFAGGSVRGAMCGVMGRHYTGIDIRPQQVKANEVWYTKNRHKHDLLDATSPTWIVGDVPSPATVAPGEYDFALTCPPYGNLEVYSDMPDDISTKEYVEFKELYRRAAAELYTLLKDNAFAVIVVGEFRTKTGEYYNFVGDTITAYLDAGFQYYNEVIYETPLGTLILRARKQMTATRKAGKTHQNVLVFGKNLNKTLVTPSHQNVLVFSKGDVRKTNAVVRNVFTNIDIDVEEASLSEEPDGFDN